MSQRFQGLIAWARRHKGTLQFLTAGLVAWLAFLWTYKTVRIVYAINDDVGLRDIASGRLFGAPDGHLIYVQYVLGWLISRLFLINAHLDWYGLTLLGFLYVCLLLILFRALQVAATFKRQVAAIAAVLVGYALFGLQHVAEFQFTTVAGVLAGTAIFWYYTADPQTPRRRCLDPAICVLLMLASYMVRSRVLLMALPFAALAFLCKDLDWPNRRIRSLFLPVCLLVGLGAVFLVEQAAYSDPGWKTYQRLLEMDTQIYDYCGLPRYAANQEFYQSIGVSGATWQLLDRYTLAPNPAVNTGTFQAIATRCRQLASAPAASTPPFSRLDELVHRLFGTMLDGGYALINIACAILFVLLLVKRRHGLSHMDAFLVLGLMLIHFGEWLYLIANGRYPDRVIWAFYLIEVLLLAAIALKDSESFALRWSVAYLWAVGLMAIALAAALVGYQSQLVTAAVHGKAEANKGCERVYAYAAQHPDNFYFLSIRSFSYCTQTFTIRADDHSDNYTFNGGWESYAPLMKAHLSALGLGDIQQNLISHSNILVLIRPPDSIDYLVNYYRSMDLSVLGARVDTIDTGDDSDGVSVYQLTASQDSIP